MKTILSTTAAFSIAGAIAGYATKLIAVRAWHSQGFPLPLADWLYASISGAIYGVSGCFIGLLFGLTLHWLTGRSKPQSSDY